MAPGQAPGKAVVAVIGAGATGGGSTAPLVFITVSAVPSHGTDVADCAKAARPSAEPHPPFTAACTCATIGTATAISSVTGELAVASTAAQVLFTSTALALTRDRILA